MDSKKTADAQPHDLELYIMNGCPFCTKVKAFIIKNELEVPERNISTDVEAEQKLIAVGGKRQVPCLFIDGKPLYESNDIITWLRDNML